MSIHLCSVTCHFGSCNVLPARNYEPCYFLQTIECLFMTAYSVPDPWHWIKNLFERWYGWVFRFYAGYLRENSRARKRETSQSVQFSSVLWLIGSSGGWGHEGRFSRDHLLVFSAGGLCEQFWYGQGCPLFVVVPPAFPLPTTASPTLQGALKDGFGEAVVACDMPEPCDFPSLGSCQKRFLWKLNL